MLRCLPEFVEIELLVAPAFRPSCLSHGISNLFLKTSLPSLSLKRTSRSPSCVSIFPASAAAAAAVHFARFVAPTWQRPRLLSYLSHGLFRYSQAPLSTFEASSFCFRMQCLVYIAICTPVAQHRASLPHLINTLNISLHWFFKSASQCRICL